MSTTPQQPKTLTPPTAETRGTFDVEDDRSDWSQKMAAAAEEVKATEPSPYANPAAPAPSGPAPTIEQLRERFGNLVARPPQRDKNIKMLTYGDAGVGKTTLYGSAQKVKGLKDLLVFDIEGGTMSLADDPDIDVIPMTTFAQFARMKDWLRLYCKARDAKDKARMVMLEQALKPWKDPAEIAAKPKIYRSVAIDSLSEAAKLCMYQLLGVEVGEQELDIEPDSPEFKQWGAASEMVRLLVRTYKALPMSVFFVCGMNTVEDEKKRIHYQPALSGKLAQEIHGFVDVVGFMAARAKDENTMERRLYLQPSELFQAKDRYHPGNSVKYLVNPTMADFLQNSTVQPEGA